LIQIKIIHIFLLVIHNIDCQISYRYLASGDSMMSLKYQYYVAQSTITNIIKETCNVLWTTLMPIVLKVPTYNTWKQIAENFELKCNFPHCIGAVDGKHVIIQVIFLFSVFISFFFIYLFTCKTFLYLKILS